MPSKNPFDEVTRLIDQANELSNWVDQIVTDLLGMQPVKDPVVANAPQVSPDGVMFRISDRAENARRSVEIAMNQLSRLNEIIDVEDGGLVKTQAGGFAT